MVESGNARGKGERWAPLYSHDVPKIRVGRVGLGSGSDTHFFPVAHGHSVTCHSGTCRRNDATIHVYTTAFQCCVHAGFGYKAMGNIFVRKYIYGNWGFWTTYGIYVQMYIITILLCTKMPRTLFFL